MDDDHADPPPIRGAPANAPRPPFPESVTPAPRFRDFENAETLPDPDEIARRIDALTHRRKMARIEAVKADRNARKIALQCDLETATWLTVIVDHHKYEPAQFLEFAKKRGINNKTDAYDLYHVGQVAGAEWARCEAEAANNPRYKWPSWGQIRKRLRRTNGPPDTAPEPEPEPAPPAPTPAPEPHDAEPVATPRNDTTQDAASVGLREEYDALLSKYHRLMKDRNLALDSLESARRQIADLRAQLAERNAAFAALRTDLAALRRKAEKLQAG